MIGAVLSKPKARILIVDDDISILKGFRSILEREGYSVETAETGKEATEKIENEKFNVYLVDVRLPDMDGTELLLKTPKDCETTRIIITGFSSEEVGKRAADYGADDYLVKPVRPEDLLTIVKERLEPIEADDQPSKEP